MLRELNQCPLGCPYIDNGLNETTETSVCDMKCNKKLLDNFPFLRGWGLGANYSCVYNAQYSVMPYRNHHVNQCESMAETYSDRVIYTQLQHTQR